MSAPDTAAPAPAVYLCQVGARVSCGACCGLYNVADLARPALESMLSRRTAAFARTPRTETGLDAFRRQMEGWTPPTRPFPAFYHCTFLGLVGRPLNRVGCLLHPDVPGNGRVDLRAFSYYGAKACRSYFCTASRRLSHAQAAIVRHCLDHWHPYGLVITEHRLLKALFDELARRSGRPPQPEDFHQRPQAVEAFRALATLKIGWPYRRPGSPGPCHQVLEDRERTLPAAGYSGPGDALAPYARIFCELDTFFATRRAQEAAVQRLDHLFNRLTAVLI